MQPTKGEEMYNVKRISLLVLIVSAFVMSACGGTQGAVAEVVEEVEEVVEEAVEEAVEEVTEELTYVDGIPDYGCLGSAEDAIVDLECQEITVAVENAYLPFNYIVTETMQASGWDYEVIPEICQRLHCQPVFVETVWETMVQQTSEGQFDVAADGISIKEDRDEQGDFSIPYMNSSMRILVNSGEDRFTSIEEFAENPDLIMGTQINTTNYDKAIEYLPEERVKAFDTFPFANAALLAGDVDAVIMDEVIGLLYQGEKPDELELISDVITGDDFGFYFPSESDLVDPFNLALQSMMDDGFLDEINLKYMSSAFVITYDDVQ